MVRRLEIIQHDVTMWYLQPWPVGHDNRSVFWFFLVDRKNRLGNSWTDHGRAVYTASRSMNKNCCLWPPPASINGPSAQECPVRRVRRSLRFVSRLVRKDWNDRWRVLRLRRSGKIVQIVLSYKTILLLWYPRVLTSYNVAYDNGESANPDGLLIFLLPL